jgi:hypothetical protein
LAATNETVTAENAPFLSGKPARSHSRLVTII